MQTEAERIEQIEQLEENEKLAKGCMGSLMFVCLLIVVPLVLLYGIGYIISDKTEVAWYGKGYYLQQETSMAGQSGYGLYYQIDNEKELILPHVYGYKKEKGHMYFAAGEGYGVIDLRTGAAKIIFPERKNLPDNHNNIIYLSTWSNIPLLQQRQLEEFPHKMNAYFFGGGWMDSYAVKVGDGRFQYEYGWYSSDHIEKNLEVYGLYGNFDKQDSLLQAVSNFAVNKKTQMMYVTSPQGYAIVDGLSGTCRVYFTDQALAEKEYQKDIYVLDSFEDFTPEEQEILRQVEKDGLP